MKKITRFDTTSWWMEHPDKCAVCGGKAEYVLRAFSFWHGTHVRSLCEKCRQAWYTGNLAV